MSENIPPLDFILLDFDGTLVDSETAFAHFDAELLNDAIQKGGSPLRLTASEVREWAGMNAEEKFSKAEEKCGFDLFEFRDDYLAKRQAGRLTLMRDMNVELQKGVEGLLRDYAHKCGIASNKRAYKLVNDLKCLGVMDYFMNRVWGAEGRFKRKPDPEMLVHILQELCLAPEKVAYVGDLPDDIKAAKAAGMVAIGFVDRRSAPIDIREIFQNSGADYIIDDMQELIPSL